MIADALGVTKAAVYHQFRSKHDIVLAAATTELARLEAVVAAAEAQSSRRRAREEAISGIVELAVATRRRVGTLLADPVIVTHFANHEGFRRVMLRLQRVLTGDDKRPANRLRTAMLIAAISGAATHPLVTDVDDATLRRELRHMARRFLERVVP